jgi:hypothetical protein
VEKEREREKDSGEGRAEHEKTEHERNEKKRKNRLDQWICFPTRGFLRQSASHTLHDRASARHEEGSHHPVGKEGSETHRKMRASRKKKKKKGKRTTS